MPRKYEMVRLAEHEGDHWRVVPADLVESFLGSEVSYKHVTAIDERDVEPLVEAARSLNDAVTVEAIVQAVNDVRKAFEAFEGSK